MAKRYYHAENCNRRFEHGIEFTPYALHGGTWCGLLATEDEARQEYLSGMAGNPATAVRELSEAEYGERLKKANGTAAYSPSPEPFKPKALPAPKPQPARLAAKAGVVVNDPEPTAEEPPVTTSEPLGSVAEALQVDKVEKAGEPVTVVKAAPAPKKK